MGSGSDLDVDEHAALGFGLVLGSGLATAIGASAVYFDCLVVLSNKLILAGGIGIASGVMLYISFVEIIFKSQEAFVEHGHTEEDAFTIATTCFFGGILFMKFLSFVVHKLDPTHSHCVLDHDMSPEQVEQLHRAGTEGGAEARDQGVGPDAPASAPQGGDAVRTDQTQSNPSAGKTDASKEGDAARLKKMGLSTALAIALHNFPEGLATFVATVADPTVGITLAIGIGIHNMPEGLCVALPIYYASGAKHTSFMWGLLSGASEPLGAIFAYALLKATGEELNQVVYGLLFGLVGGMMVAIVVSELIPTAYRYDPRDKVVSNSVFFGMLIMALSLVCFSY